LIVRVCNTALALVLVPLLLVSVGCTPGATNNSGPPAGIVLNGVYDEDDVLWRPGRKDSNPARRLTQDEYNAIRKFLERGTLRTYTNLPAVADAGAVVIDGRQFRMLQHSFYEDDVGRSWRIVVDGVEFTSPDQMSVDFTRMIEWADGQSP